MSRSQRNLYRKPLTSLLVILSSERSLVSGAEGACQRAGGGACGAEPPEAAGCRGERVPEGRAGRPAEGQRGHGEGAAEPDGDRE